MTLKFIIAPQPLFVCLRMYALMCRRTSWW